MLNQTRSTTQPSRVLLVFEAFGRLFLLSYSLFSTSFSFATPNFCEGLLQVQHPAPHLSLGETVLLSHSELAEPLEVQFLGKTLNLNHTLEHALFFDVKNFEIHILPYTQLQLQKPTTTLKSIFIRSENQVGGTCAAYSMFNCLRQTELSLQAEAPEALKKAFQDESARIRTLMRATHDYYMKSESIGQVFQKLASDSGVKTFIHPRRDASMFQESILEHLRQGHPTLLRFSIASEMLKTEYTLFDHAPNLTAPKAMDRRLWVPFQSKGFFDRAQSAGHAVTLLAEFKDTLNRHWILVSDPNWQAPRLWPVEYLSRLKSANLEAWSLFL